MSSARSLQLPGLRQIVTRSREVAKPRIVGSLYDGIRFLGKGYLAKARGLFDPAICGETSSRRIDDHGSGRAF